MQLLPITPENHVDVRKLAVHPEQAQFVANIDKTLADAFIWKNSVFRVAFEEEIPVGFILLFPFEDSEKRVVNMVRIMIDGRFQGRGLGRQLMNTSLDWIRSFEPKVNRVRISTSPDNHIALSLYQSCGFIEKGIENEEIALYLEL